MLRGVAVAILVLLSPPGHAQAPADTNDLDSIQRALDQAKAAQVAAARRKAAALAAAKRKQHQTPAPTPADPAGMDLEAERQRMAPSYKAISLAWDNRGNAAARVADTLEQAREAALEACNDVAAANGGADCYFAGMDISPTSRRCYAVSRDTTGRMSQASGVDLATAREASLGQCSSNGTGCTNGFSGCNDP